MVKRNWLLVVAGLAVLLVTSTALGGSVNKHKRFQRTFVCVNLHNG